MGPYIENTGTTSVRFVEMFRSDRYEDVSLAQWLALVSPGLVRQHLPVGTRFLRALPKKKPVVN